METKFNLNRYNDNKGLTPNKPGNIFTSNLAGNNYRYPYNYGAGIRNITFGDRMFVRVIARGQTLLEMFTDRVSDYTELIGEIRRQLHGFSGLTKLWIRNHSQGWAVEKPLMFYAPRRNPSVIRTQNAPAPKRMLAPWETH